jgi:REP element-mobilizing transposase RayT
MSRKPRLHYPGALYHVITRGNNRQKIFLSDEDYACFLEKLKAVKAKKQFMLHAYCLMPNHVHLLVTVENTPLSGIMQRVLTGYTSHFHRTHKKSGHVFQGRYKAIICEKDSYLMELVRYIHLNPVRAGLARRPGDWGWSGHRSYLAADHSEGLIDDEALCELFGTDKNRARQAYEQFMRDGAGMGHKASMYPRENVPFLGEGRFVEEHQVRHLEVIEQRTPGSLVKKPPLQGIMRGICAKSALSPAMLQGASRRGDIVARRKTFILQAHRSGHTCADIARYINRTQAYVSRLVDVKPAAR